ncbi:MAG: ribbon-helix-helix protein, CopG family [Candidatus Competibacteraceae bacterium]
MKTTLNLDDDLMCAVEQRANETGQSVSAMIEAALRAMLSQEDRQEHAQRMRWVTVSGGVQPGVDLNDRNALLERMEQQR